MTSIRAPIIAGFVVMFLGTFIITYFNLYNTYPHLDKFLHTAGGFIVAWFFVVYWSDKLGAYSRFERLILCTAMAALVGFFWEVAEYSTSFPAFADYPILRHYLYAGSLLDTLGDFMADIFGAAMFALFFRR